MNSLKVTKIFVVSELPDEEKDRPMARILMWLAILGATTVFWIMVALAILAWLRVD